MTSLHPGSPEKPRTVAPPVEDSTHGGASRLLKGSSLWQSVATRAATLRRHRWLRTYMGLTLVVVCSLFLGYGVYVNWQQLPHYDWHLDYWFFGLSLFLYVLSFGFLVVGWNSIMRRIGGPSSLRDNAAIYCYSNILRRIPPAVWFVAGRIYLYRGKGVSGIVSSMGTFLEIVLIIVSGALVHLLFRPVAATGVTPLTYLLVAIPPLGIVAMYLVCNKGRRLWDKRAGHETERMRPVLDWIDVGRWLLLYGAAWLAGGAVLHTFVLSLYGAAGIGIVDSVGIWAASGVIGSLPFFVPAGLGVREATLSFLLSQYAPVPVAIVVSVLFRIFTMTGETVCSLMLIAVLRFGLRE